MGITLTDGRNIPFRTSNGTDELSDVLNITLVEGRWFSPDDDARGSIPIVMNQRMAREIFGDRSAAGERIALAALPERPNRPASLRVVGVMEDFRQDGELTSSENYMFQRIRLGEDEFVDPVSEWERDVPSALVIRVVEGTTAAFEETVLNELRAVAGDWTFQIRAIAEMRAEQVNQSLRPVIIASIVASFLLVMVILGLTGVVWQSVTRRTQEFGLRRANGATAADVRRQVLMELVLLASIAAAVGVAMVAQIPVLPLPSVGFTPQPEIFAASIAVSVAVIYLLTLLCGWYPSRLATRIQPADALHYE
jgi:putative ABC transport system permease protein